MTDSATTLPDALLLITAGCAHCPAAIDALTRLVKEGAIGRLEVVNVAAHPEYAEQRGVRAVPWTQLGDFELEGAQPLEALRRWALLARTADGMSAYFEHLLDSGQLARTVGMIRARPERFDALLALMGNPGTSLGVRIGMAAVFEELRENVAMADIEHALGVLTQHADAAIRADACHALSFTQPARAQPYLEACLNDTDAQVREIAAESLDALAAR